ncbi:MAG TPA: alkaline phosphatase family protein, partial [Dermatophilaceae bacterium]|nr:alkaline phosphatase family protein [Dermatophilaceae bacterium]
PSSLSIGQALDGDPKNPLTGQIFDSTLPAGAPPGSHSHMDCFSKRFAGQLAANAVPAFSYLTMTSNHTRGTQPGFPTPAAMVADNDLALGQLVQTISQSSIWSSSAIFVVEDDSQDGADHVNAHRIPALVISPYTRAGAVIHTRYDLPSVVRTTSSGTLYTVRTASRHRRAQGRRAKATTPTPTTGPRAFVTSWGYR